MTDKTMWRLGYNAARQAGLDANTADAVGHRVAEQGRALINANPPTEQVGGSEFNLRTALRAIVAQEVQRHAAP